jgi:hypothetical protein
MRGIKYIEVYHILLPIKQEDLLNAIWLTLDVKKKILRQTKSTIKGFQPTAKFVYDDEAEVLWVFIPSA